MKIPKKFRLLGHEFNVVYVSDLIEDQGAAGFASYGTGRVQLQDVTKPPYNAPVSHLEEIFLHELTHHILDQMSEAELRKNEKFVEGFSRLLHQALTTMKY